MAYDLTLMAMAKGLARHASTRQALVTQNVANADTIGFRARDLRSFSAVYEETMSAQAAQRARVALGSAADLTPVGPDAFRATATRPGHAGYAEAGRAGVIPGPEAQEAALVNAESPNGNSVSLEDQMARGAEAALSHEMALGIARKSMDLLRMAIGRAR